MNLPEMPNTNRTTAETRWRGVSKLVASLVLCLLIATLFVNTSRLNAQHVTTQDITATLHTPSSTSITAVSTETEKSQIGGVDVDYETITQVSTYDYFASGHMDGIMSLADLKKYGDFGLGTFDKIDGEMVEVAGTFYQVRPDGLPHSADETITTPFAVVSFFQSVTPVAVAAGLSKEALQKQIDQLATNANVFVVIRLEGKFSKLQLRSVPAQNKPYPPLADVVKLQKVFDYTNIEGTLVGVRSPDFSKGLNAVGYHFHFISKDHKAGGHVLDLTTGDSTLQINEKSAWKLFLPPSHPSK